MTQEVSKKVLKHLARSEVGYSEGWPKLHLVWSGNTIHGGSVVSILQIALTQCAPSRPGLQFPHRKVLGYK